MNESAARAWPGRLTAVTLFVEDLAAAKEFYERVFDLRPVHEDDDSVAFGLGVMIINLLAVTSAPELVAPAEVGDGETGARFQLTVEVEDVDGVCATLAARGVELLNGPMDRPWGVRTASFRDPGGHIWEIAS